MECLEKADFALKCNSNEMAPFVCTGDLVLVSKQSPENGQLAVLRVHGENIVRRYYRDKNNGIVYSAQDERYTLRSTDAQGSEIEIIGRAVGIVRNI